MTELPGHKLVGVWWKRFQGTSTQPSVNIGGTRGEEGNKGTKKEEEREERHKIR